MQATPPSGAPAPGGDPQDQSQGPGPAEQAIKMIQGGFQQLGALIQKAQGNLDPSDVQLFQKAAQATDNMIQSLVGPPQSASRPQQSGPIPANAAPNGSQGQNVG